jgi:hypothetical protein
MGREALINNMKIKKEYISVVLFMILLLVLTLRSSSVIGVTASNIERDARVSQKIEDTWSVSKSVNKNIAAMLFYNDNRDKYIFSVYLNHPGFSLGYFFRTGGTISGIEDGVSKFEYDKNGAVLISMNTKEIDKIELYNGINTKIISIDSTKPFAQVIPSNSGEITLYDVNGVEVSINELIKD